MPADDYTPDMLHDLVEDAITEVRDAFPRRHDDAPSADVAAEVLCRIEPHLARVRAEAGAQALRDAADEMQGGFNQDTLNLERRQIKRWLRARADTITQEDTP